METAAEEYARLKAETFNNFLEASFSDEALKGVDLYEVKVPTGKTFKCRKLDTSYAAVTASMPMALSEQMLRAKAAKDGELPVTEMTETEERANIQVNAQIVRYICVEPRVIVGEVNGHKNAISSDMMTMGDFTHLVRWAAGGDATPGLKTFRKRRR